MTTADRLQDVFGIGQDVIAEDFQGSIAIGRVPHEAVGRDLARGADDRFENLIKGFKQPPIRNWSIAGLCKAKKLRQLLPVETENRFISQHGHRDFAEAKGLELPQGLRIVLNIPPLEKNSILRKKLFRAAAGKSTRAVVNLGRFHRYCFYLSLLISRRRYDLGDGSSRGTELDGKDARITDNLAAIFGKLFLISLDVIHFDTQVVNAGT